MMRLFRRRVREAAPGRAAVPADIALAYRLILRREPDAEGMAHYEARIAAGLTIDALIQSLLTSTEYRVRQDVAEEGERRSDSHAAAPEGERIDPEDVIARYSVEELAETADAYYRRVEDPTPLMAKPFAFLHETPEMLESLAAILSGLRLGKSMTVLDFGAGTCWLSRILAQLHCHPIACDTSAAALEIGRRLFAEYPVIGPAVVTPHFLRFDGHMLDLPDGAVDRIICFDAFHHVPNPEVVLREFGRVLAPGGIAGFSEPGPRHSRSPQAQYEMRNHRVLENDIDLGQILQWARGAGFTDMSVRLTGAGMMSFAEYASVLDGAGDRPVAAVAEDARRTLADKSVFFLHKGEFRSDSRSHEGLSHQLRVHESQVRFIGRSVRVTCTVKNTGSARWLHTNKDIFGIVRLGAHLYDETGTLLDVDHFRADLPQSVEPGESLELAVVVPVPASRPYRLGFDLVAEGVCWFENQGSTPAVVTLTPD
jgi:SAM-dependent methyltransferase